MNRSSMWALLVTGSLLCLGCRSPAELNAVFAKAKTLQTSPDYVVGEGDSIDIRVLGEREMLVVDTVRPDGKVAFPTLGDLTVAGKTVEQIRGELTDQLKKTIENPAVFVTLKSFASKSVTVIGEVAVQGRFAYTGQMRVTDLLGLTRGLLLTSAPNRSLLFREVDGNTKVYHVFLKDFLEKADFSTNFFVQPGDILFIPKNGFSKVAAAIEIGVSPLAALLSFITVGGSTTAYFVP